MELVTDVEIQLAQVKERLSQEINAHEIVKEQLHTLSTSLEERVANRTRALAALYEIMVVANNAESLEHLLDETLRQAMVALQCDTGIIILFENEPGLTTSSTARVIVEHSNHFDIPHKKGSWLAESVLLSELVKLSEPLLIPDLSQDDRFPVKMRQLKVQLLLAPVRFADQFQGVVGMIRPTGIIPTETEIATFSSVTNQIGAAVHQLELRTQVQHAKLLAERERLGRDLHDTITQSLYGLAAMAEAGEAQLEANDTHSASHTFKRIGQTTRQALREMRLFIHELRPDTLEQNGLIAALQLRLAAVEGRTDTQVRLVADGNLQVPQKLENALYRIALEALNNTMRHARANNVTVLLQREKNKIVLEVIDDGCGFDPQKVVHGGMGLDNMTVYAGEIGAQLQVNSVMAQGTTIRVAATYERM